MSYPRADSIQGGIVADEAVTRWFGEYLDTFAACGRGDMDANSLLGYYGVPFLVATDAGFIALTNEDQVAAVAKQQVDGMQAADYDHTDVLDSEVTLVNATSAVFRGEFSRIRADGAEINRLTVTYLITDGSAGRRISVLAVGP